MWSFNQGMGQNIFPIGYTDPFSLYIILMGKNFVYYSIFYAEVFKIFCAGFFFYLFLKKTNLTSYTAIIGGILYSFTGYIIVGGTWISFSTQAVYIALMLYSFEKLYQDDNWILFPISIFLIASYQPLDLYFIGVFLVIYIIFRLFEDNEKGSKDISSLLRKLIFLGAAGMAMSAFFIINGLQVIIESPRVSGDASYFNALFSHHIWAGEGESLGKTHYLTALMRFFSCDILGTGDNFRGWNNYLEAPLFYCGLISLVLFPHFLSANDKRKKMIYFTFIVIMILPVVFPFLRYSYWLFTGNYYRVFSFFVAITILLIGLKCIDKIDLNSKADIKIIVSTLFLFLFILYYPYKNSQIIDKNIRDTVAVFLMVYSVLIYLLQFRKINSIIKVMILSAVVMELICLYNPSVNKRPVISVRETMEKVNYNDYTVDAVAFIKSNDKSFFRINKGYYSIPFSKYVSLNDAKAQDFYGTPSYTSFNQLNYIKFLQAMEIVGEKKEVYTRWSIGLSKSPLLHSFASIKYTLAKEQKPIILDFEYTEIEKIGDVRVLENKYFLPLGFTYEKYISMKDFKTLPKDQKMYALYKAVVIDDSLYKDFDGLEKLNMKEIPRHYLVDEYKNDIELLRKNTLNISKHRQNIIMGEINLDKNKMLFFSIPFDKGWNIKVDGKNVKPMMVNIGFIGVPVEKGLHQIELSFIPLYFYTGAAISIIAMFSFCCLIAFKYLRNRKFN